MANTPHILTNGDSTRVTITNGTTIKTPITLPQVHSSCRPSNVSSIQSLLQRTPKLYKYRPDQMEIVVLRRTGEVERISNSTARIKRLKKSQMVEEVPMRNDPSPGNRGDEPQINGNHYHASFTPDDTINRLTMSDNMVDVVTRNDQRYRSLDMQAATMVPSVSWDHDTPPRESSDAPTSESGLAETLVTGSTYDADSTTDVTTNSEAGLGITTQSDTSWGFIPDNSFTNVKDAETTMDELTCQCDESTLCDMNCTIFDTTRTREAIGCLACEALAAKDHRAEILELRKSLESAVGLLKKSQHRLKTLTKQNARLIASETKLRTGFSELSKLIEASNAKAEIDDIRIAELLNRTRPKCQGVVGGSGESTNHKMATKDSSSSVLQT